MKLNFILNGEDTTVEVAENTRLVDLLRNEFHLTGTKEGCGVGECGACTVVLDGKAVASCLVLAVSVEGNSASDPNLDHCLPLLVAKWGISGKGWDPRYGCYGHLPGRTGSG